MARTLGRISAAVVALCVIATVVRVASFYSFYSPQVAQLGARVKAQVQAAGGPYTPLPEVPRAFSQAVVATEDRRFYSHAGIDTRGLVRALYRNLRQERLAEGASTITQQLARGQFLSRRKSVIRKLKEMLLALAIERSYSKSEILEMYLNQSYFGHGATGIGQAARIYLSEPARSMDVAESALIAGILRGPSLYDPFVNPGLAKARQAEVLRNMVAVGYLTAGEAEAAYRERVAHVQPAGALGIE